MENEQLDTFREDGHDALLALLNPLVAFMEANGYSYFMVAGKDGVCSRHMMGTHIDLSSMLLGMMDKNPQVANLLLHTMMEFTDKE